ncbi:MAG: hypothetical protein AAF570_20755 [Bacteroidota bacterium]
MEKRPLNILLIAREPEGLQHFHDALRPYGDAVRVHPIAGHAAAFDQIKTTAVALSPPRIAVLDLETLADDGVDLMQHFRSDPQLSGLPIYVLTQADRKQDIAAAHRFNAAACLTKPAQNDQYPHMVQTLTKFWEICEF